MSSKASPSPSKARITNEEFLAACIKCTKEKVQVDFDALAQVTGMSSGGASNKFRAIMKQLEADGAVWAKPSGDVDASPAKPNVAAKKRKTQQADAADDDAKDSAEEGESPSKKPKTKKGVARSTKKNVKSEADVKEENGEEEDGDEGTTTH